MTKLFLSFMMLFISIFIFFMNHPLSMGMLILLQTFILCLLSGMMINTYWFSYILFLTFLGGLLVLFIYVSSIASNEIFNMNFYYKFMIFIMFFMICLLSIFFMNNLNWLNIYNNNEMNNFFNMFFFNNENNISLMKMYNEQTFYLMMMMIIYLFITLIAVVKITNIYFGPLRPSY